MQNLTLLNLSNSTPLSRDSMRRIKGGIVTNQGSTQSFGGCSTQCKVSGINVGCYHDLDGVTCRCLDYGTKCEKKKDEEEVF